MAWACDQTVDMSYAHSTDLLFIVLTIEYREPRFSSFKKPKERQ